MDRTERQKLLRSLGWLKPGQHVEVRVDRLRALIELCDALERYQPDHHFRIALAHAATLGPIDGCACASCEGHRAAQRLTFAEAMQNAERAIEQAERGELPKYEMVREGPRSYLRRKDET